MRRGEERGRLGLGLGELHRSVPAAVSSSLGREIWAESLKNNDDNWKVLQYFFYIIYFINNKYVIKTPGVIFKKKIPIFEKKEFW